MEIFLNSFFLIFLGEMGDKTQLLSLVLVTRFRKPWTILFGVFLATVVNHALATWAGGWVSSLVEPTTMRWILAALFIGFGLWILIPDKEEEFQERGHFGVLLTTVIAFFLAEMGDKTQLATIALGARYQNLLLVTLGTTLGMLASNALAIFLGKKLLDRVPMSWVRAFACGLFLLFGLGILLGY